MAISLLVNEATPSAVIASLIAAAVVGLVVFLFRNTILRAAKYWLPRLESKTPHLNFQTETSNVGGGWGTTVTISNAGNEPAYNVYVFMVERFPVGGSFKIRSLGSSGIRRPVLGIRDSLRFNGVDMRFDGCNATKQEQLWIEFENSAGVAFRVVSIPPTPRGDDERALPPRVIRHRLEQLPELNEEGDYRDWKEYWKGARTAYGQHGWRGRLDQTRRSLYLRVRPNYIPKENEGPFRSWLADRLM